MTEVLRPCLGKFAVVYFDDILIYNNNQFEHLSHLEAVFKILREQKLYGKLEKCTFMVNEVAFMGRFIRNFSSVVTPITECIRKEDFQWTDVAQHSFEKIKKLMCETPILNPPDFDQLFEVECEASGVRIGAVIVRMNFSSMPSSSYAASPPLSLSEMVVPAATTVSALTNTLVFLVSAAGTVFRPASTAASPVSATTSFTATTTASTAASLCSSVAVTAAATASTLATTDSPAAAAAFRAALVPRTVTGRSSTSGSRCRGRGRGHGRATPSPSVSAGAVTIRVDDTLDSHPEFPQTFTFSSKYKEGKHNVVADALSRRHSLLTFMSNKVLGFEFMKEMYMEDPDFFEE
ncbi:uncharacterized protein LOC141613899 [Silene latifolia]|uniref:uncharacterized protein LOC141613899 n=1 Tax=Silene latifolia TaxID=37657 RepID=UPI003D785125